MIDARQAVLTSNADAGGMLTAVRFAFRTMSKLSPALTARLAGRIWFTPPRPPLRKEARALLESGKREDVFVNHRRVVTWSWGDGPTVLLMHGWGGMAAQMGSFVEPLVRAGHRVITFDAPSHGFSGPSRIGTRQSTLFDFADALVEVSRKAGDVTAVVAHSGGCTSTAWAIRKGWRVPAAVFIAPMGSPRAYQQVFQRAIGISDDVLRRFAENTERLLDFQWEDLEMTEVPRYAQTPRTLVVHDRHDPETPYREGAAVAAHWPNATLRTTEGLGHRKVLRDPAIIRSVVEFVSD